MASGNFSARSLLLNAAVVLAALSLALLRSVRHAHWGPEGPVGAWLLVVPYVLLGAAVTGVLIARGSFSWVPGGRLACIPIWLGLLVCFAVSGYYSMSDPETKFEQLAALFGWVLLAGCLVAVNADPSTAAKAAIVATLGLGGAAGWLQVASWLSDHAKEQQQIAESRIASEQQFQESLDAGFRALGTGAPLWKYFDYMYLSNEALRKECLAIIAGRADRDARLAEYLGNETLAPGATRYIGEFHPAPGPALASAFARRSDLVLSEISEFEKGPDQISDRSHDDIRDIVRAAARIQGGGGDLAAQLQAWRSYLKRFRNTGDLVAEIDRALPQAKAR
jgi:hypothetical protein